MLDQLGSLGWVVLALVFLGTTLGAIGELQKASHRYSSNDHRRNSTYRTRTSVMDTREQAFFLELRKQLPTDRYLFPKMRIADIVETTNGKGYRRQLYKILPKHVDFLITDHSFRPLFAIELNGSSHNRSDRAESDSLKQAIFSDIGLKLYTVQIGKEFALEIGRILSEQGVLNKA